jgi:peptide/nickel transport system permease protein
MWLLQRQPVGVLAGAVILVLIACGLFAGALAPYRVDDFDVSQRLLDPSAVHLFGTDEQGRDVFSRVLLGAQSSVVIGFSVVTIATCIAVTIGTLCGYFGGWFDLIVQRFVDVWLSFPGLIFVILVLAIFGSRDVTFVLTLSLLLCAGSSRIIRSATIALRNLPYIEAARSIGAR